ncbi:LLM class flavin-dependent oxidoreductase [Amycolatopsis sp. NPDC051903]|uniref:LLM class flavin-dependent oxidoreductase n=1 Tax=Amycolatopsis sp. NPDC051903 TaxID=3363936 RepID=UPI0037A65B87
MRVSVLDTSPIVRGATARQALQRSVDLAVLADELGFHRYWVPEHHSMRGVASAAPAVVAGRLAAATRRIRVGAGGVLLPNHAPLVVAEQFGTLEAFFPGRIDLGLGRALGGPAYVADAVRRAGEDFPGQVDELLAYFAEGDGRIRAVPAAGHRPEVWLLGSGTGSARVARERNLPYAFAHHLNADGAEEALGAYGNAGAALLSVAVIVADTDERAEWLAGPARLKVLSRLRGQRILLPDPGTAAEYPYTEDDRAEIAARCAHLVVGSPDTAGAKLRDLLDRTGAGELMVTTPVFDHADRRRSYELLASIAQRTGGSHSG